MPYHNNQNRSYGQPNRHRGQSSRQPEADITPVLKSINLDEISPELFDSIAENTAKIIADCKKEVNEPTQIRRFYDEVVMWFDKLQSQPDSYQKNLPFIKMLNARVAYAEGRNHVDKNFKKLMAHCLAQLDGKKIDTFYHFKYFMEAFMGFYKSYKR